MSSTVSFALDGQRVDVDFTDSSWVNPTTTLLNFLRNRPDHRGVKEGCAEGDCGACTVVLGELTKANTIQYRAVDSCLVFLPMIHGKQVITIEDLAERNGGLKDLHPVQTAMVEKHGSQCGYCTPGIVMSLFALYKNYEAPSTDVILDALTGNLCRCTGYKPIIEAAAAACAKRKTDKFACEEPRMLKLLAACNKPARSLAIETKRQAYYAPTALKEALELRSKHPDALLITGATDIALRVTKKRELLAKIIDLSHLDDLRQVFEKNFELHLGAAADLNRIRLRVEKTHPALGDMLKVFGSLQIRNLATLGGNLGSGSPIGDALPVLMAYDARVVLQNARGSREVAVEDFIKGYRKTAVKKDEIIKTVVIPKQDDAVTVRFYKVSKRKDLDISTVSGGFRLALGKAGEVKSIRLFYGGMAEMVRRARKAETFLAGKRWDRESVELAMRMIDEDFTPISDARSGAEGRRIAARNLLLKFWSDTNAG